MDLATFREEILSSRKVDNTCLIIDFVADVREDDDLDTLGGASLFRSTDVVGEADAESSGADERGQKNRKHSANRKGKTEQEMRELK